jgi:hypothetical protein
MIAVLGLALVTVMWLFSDEVNCSLLRLKTSAARLTE